MILYNIFGINFKQALNRFLLLLAFLSLTTFPHGQIIYNVAGNSTYGYSGDGNLAIDAQLGYPSNVVADTKGNLYISDFDNAVIRKVDANGIISTFAGTGIIGYSGDSGPAVKAQLFHPAWLAIDHKDNLYFMDQNSDVIRQIDTRGIITSITENLPPGYSGDGGPLIKAQFYLPTGIAFDENDNMYISDGGNNVIRKVDELSGVVTTIAGNRTSGHSGDGGLATNAEIAAIYEVAFDSKGNMYIPCDNRIRKVDTNGIISTIAGNGIAGYKGDGGLAINAQLAYPWTITTDRNDNIYIGDVLNFVVRKIDAYGNITTFAGRGVYGNTGDGGPATNAELGYVSGVFADQNSGDIYLCIREYFNVIKKINTCLTASIQKQPSNEISCNGGDISFNVESSNADDYQWEVNIGSGWNNLIENTIYSGTTTKKINIKSANEAMSGYQYRCIVSNSCGSLSSNSVSLTVTKPITPALTITTPTNIVCAGGSSQFLATPSDINTLWNYQWKKNGLNVGIDSNIYDDNNVEKGEVIACEISTSSTCVTSSSAVSNTIEMNVQPQVVSSLHLTSSSNNICFGTPVKFVTNSTNTGANPIFEWAKNDTALSIQTSYYTDGFLHDSDKITCVLVPDQSCPSEASLNKDSVTLHVSPLITPTIAIKTDDTSICEGRVSVYTALTTNAGYYPNYTWTKNGDTVASGNIEKYVDSSLTTGDVIACSIEAKDGCLATSVAYSNHLIMTVFSKPIIFLNKNAALCSGSTIELDAGSFSSYFWNDGTRSRSLPVTNLGTYSVTVADANGCINSDSTTITTLLPQPTNFLPPDTSLCSYSSIDIASKQDFKNYIWNNLSKAKNVIVTQPGLYWLSVTDKNGCIGKDSILISQKNCISGFFIPTAFSPNGDGRNDYFKPILFGDLKTYKFSIYTK